MTLFLGDIRRHNLIDLHLCKSIRLCETHEAPTIVTLQNEVAVAHQFEFAAPHCLRRTDNVRFLSFCRSLCIISPISVSPSGSYNSLAPSQRKPVQADSTRSESQSLTQGWWNWLWLTLILQKSGRHWPAFPGFSGGSFLIKVVLPAPYWEREGLENK